MSQLDLIPLSSDVVARASAVGPILPTLDALHLASALAVQDALTAVVVYDHRVAAAARDAGLDVVQPGTPSTS